ncbi:YtjB family periplasmic protein [Pasteurellaceae bacterium LIM206]|nr:YtjB family periplasmic protein [Pasteurellaceae bacterium LIM206]
MNVVREKLVKSTLFAAVLAICVLVMGVILFGLNQFKLGSQLASVNQVSNLSHLLVRQQANLFSMLLVNNAKAEQLTETLEGLTQEHFVLDASVYDDAGKLLAQTGDITSLRNRLGLNGQASYQEEVGVQQIVEPIYSSNGLEGFLRVTFDSKYGQTTQSKINQLFHRLYGELIIVFLAGVILASSVHYFLSHYRRVRRLHQTESVKIEKTRKNSTALSFHRRRRRFK